MVIVEQSAKILMFPDDAEQLIELAGRTCYKSEDKITETSAKTFISGILKRKHETVIEHVFCTVRFITNRGVSHELVRHRLASFSQESTRYVNYGGKDIQFIRPVWVDKIMLGKFYVSWDSFVGEVDCLKEGQGDYMDADPAIHTWFWNTAIAERDYNTLLAEGWKPEEARDVLPNSLKTEVVMTANLREWRHVFSLRVLGTTGRPHPQIRALMLPLLKEFNTLSPAVFGDIYSAAEEKGLYNGDQKL